MDALVGEGIDEEEVCEPVILLVAVEMVDLVAVRLGAVLGFPCCNVAEGESSADVASEVAASGDVLSICPTSLWSSLSHAPSLPHSPRSR